MAAAPAQSAPVEYEQDIEQRKDDMGASADTKKKSNDRWLNAWRDHLAGIKAFSNCIDLADVNGDGDYKLIVGDTASKRLKVYGGTSVVGETQLLSVPSAVASFYMDYRDEVRRPSIAVASGGFIFIYKNMRPYYKFTLPPVEVDAQEQEVWLNLKSAKVTVPAAFEALRQMKEGGTILSARSIDFLSLEDNERTRFVEAIKKPEIIQQTVITCMAVLCQDKDEVGGLGCLVVGTENKRVLILDSMGSAVVKKVTLPSVPVFIVTSGLLVVDYRIVVACRNGSIYFIKNGELVGTVIELDAQPVGIARSAENQIAVATMANAIHYYHLKGKKQSSIVVPAPVSCICSLFQEMTRQIRAIIVALANGEVRTYIGKVLFTTTQVYDGVTGMKFGKYGREDATLILILKTGSVLIKMLPRTVQLEADKGGNQGPPPEQDIPLRVPKRTKLYLEQTEREKEFGVDMHRVFQRDLCKIRLQTARAYVKILTDGQGLMSFNASSSLRLTAHVQGLGPHFKIKLNVQNTGTRALVGIPVVFTYNMNTYRLPEPYIVIPSLVPSLLYSFEIPVECVDDQAGSDNIRVYVCNQQSCVPIITALVNMPVVDMLMNEQ